MGDIKKFLSELVAVWREHVGVAREQARAARETALATVVLAEHVGALRETMIELNRANMVVAERAAVAIERAADDGGLDS